MSHLTKEGLYQLISKARASSPLTSEEQEQLKLYIPMQLGEESAKRMMTMVNDIREGKRSPLSEQERIELNSRNMDESLQNFLSKLSSSSDEEMESILEMCECIRASRSNS
ncbi:hypothetical protein [Desulforamulus aquiferis]|uniref:Uncharacterized protein n=1 Tax=Desulforamulus aquiferis TaxID=1397668 RepID=A0AAW7ZB34_9FIRM|nr:hypothetical protein [Desulforamulus aquiferis]MDO7786291.1 hypothetical protein [Desulforamulus aquiferis]